MNRCGQERHTGQMGSTGKDGTGQGGGGGVYGGKPGSNQTIKSIKKDMIIG